MAPEVTYLGFRINKEGITPIPERIQDLLKAPIPKDVTQVKSFLGMLNYYHRHLPNLAETLEPLHRLLRKNEKWVWGNEQTKAFEKVKEMLCSKNLLIHYDPNKPIVLSCDASPYGIGAVLAHVMPDGSERPIAYTSRTLASAERNYAQIEKEGLAIVYAVKKFHQYIFGRHCTIITDHKPLLGLFAENKAIPPMAAARIQRWAIILSAYDYTLLYKPGTNNTNADCLSRLPIEKTERSQIDNV